MGRFQTHPFITVIGLALSIGATDVLAPQKNKATAAEPLVNLARTESSTPVLPRLLPAANTSVKSVQSLRTVAKPLWVPKQPSVDGQVQLEPVISPVNEVPPAAYQVRPENVVQTIASNHQISQRELTINRLNNPIAIRVDQLPTVPPSQVESGYATGGNGSVPATTPSVVTAAQPSGVTLPILVSQVENILVAIAPTSDDSKFRVAAIVTEPPQVHGQVISLNGQAETKVGPTARAIANSNQRQTEALQSDIQKLRAKYSAKGIGIQNNLQTVTAKLPVTSSNTLGNRGGAAIPLTAIGTGELSPEQAEALQANIQKLQDRYRAEKAEGEDPKISIVREPARTTMALTPKQGPATISTGSNLATPIVERTGFPQLLNPELPPPAPPDIQLPGENSTGPQQYVWPARGALTSGYGRRWGRMHRGIDVSAPIGTPVVAAAVGIVVSAGWHSGGYGNLVNVLHPDGSLTRYAHNKKLLVRLGQEIDQGRQIAEMGSTGRSTGPHLHFEIHPSGKGAVNPMPYLSRS